MAGTRIEIRLNGVAITYGRFNGATIRETMGPAANTGRLTLNRTAPLEGETIQILATDESPDRVLFAGEVQSVTQTYDLQKRNPRYDCALIDRTFYANKRRPFGTFTAVSASTVAAALALYAPECTTFGVVGSLPAVSLVFDGSEPFMTAWYRLVAAIGGVGGLSYLNDLSLALVDAGEAVDPVDLAHPPYNDPPIAVTWDLSQVRTRLFGKGHAEALLTDIAAAEVIIPIGSAALFDPLGGSVALSVTADGAQGQIAAYTGVQAGGGGGLVGPGAYPSAAPALVVTPGSGGGSVDVGSHDYAVTFVTGSGESLPGPRATIATSAGIADASTAPTELAYRPSGNVDTGFHRYTYTWVTAIGETLPSAYDQAFASPGPGQFDYTIPVGPTGTIARRVYRSKASNPSGSRYLVATISDNVTTTITDNTADASLPGTTEPGANTTAGKTVVLSAIPLGSATVTARKIYRTAVGSSQLKLQSTIADNTTTGATDNTSDGSLGANVPTSDGSGLAQPSGQANAGSTTLLVAGTGPFSTTGGWAIIGNGSQVIRYTGITSTTLTGIPASGIGAIVATISYNSTITAAAALTGITNRGSPSAGIGLAMAKGSAVAIWVQRDDTSAQILLALLESRFHGSPSDGIREDHLFDGRLGIPTLTAACDARLAQFSRPIVGVTYSCDDLKTRCGATVAIDLPNYGDQVLLDGATGYWGLDELSGTVAQDRARPSLPGTYIGGVTLGQTGALSDGSTAVLFNGSTGKMLSAELALAQTFSVEAFIKTAANGPIWTNRGGPSNGGIYFATSAGKLFGFMNDAAESCTTVASVIDNAYHHVVWTYDGALSRLYIDGVIQTLASGGTTKAMTHAAKIAVFTAIAWDHDNNDWFTGTIDEVAVYPTALTAAQITAHYALRLNPLAFHLAGSFIIQDVTKTFIGRANSPIVRHAVRAASSTFTLRDVIRLAQLTVP